MISLELPYIASIAEEEDITKLDQFLRFKYCR